MKILIHLGYHPVNGRNPLSFNDRGPNADNHEVLDRCIVGAMIRREGGADRNPHKPARIWYRTETKEKRYLYIARDVLQDQ